MPHAAIVAPGAWEVVVRGCIEVADLTFHRAELELGCPSGTAVGPITSSSLIQKRAHFRFGCSPDASRAFLPRALGPTVG